jgi:spoIIIJ-associated protein
VAEDGGEYTGRTVEDAVAQAEAELGLSRDDLGVEVLSPGSRGVFGLRAEPARIRVRRAASPGTAGGAERAATAEERASAARQSAPAAGAVAIEPADTQEVRPARSGADLPSEASRVLRELLETMGFHANVEVRRSADPLTLAITGQNLGVLIGRRGDNLAALQFMVNLILSKHRRQWPRVVIDVENYRARREESLRALADRIAYRVRRNQRAFTLEAMPASDRRIIHLALRDRPDVETYSIGEGPARRVVIAPKRAAQSASGRAYS